MAKPRNDLVDRIQYLVLRLFTTCLYCFPVNVNLRTARFLGSALYRLDRKHRERALANLRRSFPEMSEAQRRRLARRSMQELAMLAVEVLFTTRLIRVDSWHRYVELEDFQEVLRLFLTKNQGFILLTGHFGNWEIGGYVLATLGFETTTIARPLDNPYINNWVLGVRERQGQKILAKKGATDEVPAVLESGGTVAIMADQNAGHKGLFVDFFGRKASTYKSIGLLAMEFRVPVVVGYTRRLDDRFHFRIGVQDIIYPKDWESQDDPLRYITQRYTRDIENFVRKHPAQYLWAHRRWKSRPKGETPEQYD